MRFNVVALGELLIDFTPFGTSENGAPLYELNPGGAPCNALTAVVRQGGSAAFIGKIGQDYFGNFLADTLKDTGINTQGLVRDHRYPTTLAIVSLDSQGDRSFGFYRNASADIMLTPKEVDTSLIERAAMLHFGSLSLTDEPSRSATFYALEKAKEHNLFISYDPNLRPPLWESETQAKKHILSGLPYTDILKISKEEFLFLFDTQDYRTAAEEIMERYDISYLFVTDGPCGAYYHHNQHCGQMSTYDVAVKDTTGAGDAFTGTILYHLSQLAPENFYNLSKETLEYIVDTANASGALTTIKPGGIPAIPTAREIARCKETVPLLHSCNKNQ